MTVKTGPVIIRQDLKIPTLQTVKNNLMVSEKLSFPNIMQAVFLEKQGGALIVKEVPTPVPGPGEVLVKIAVAPINPSDLARIKTAHTWIDLSKFIPGLEGSGTWAQYMLTSADTCFP